MASRRVIKLISHLSTSNSSFPATLETKASANDLDSTHEEIASYDVVVVGAGVSGLVTALDLLEQGLDPSSIVVLEMRNRVGGRTLNVAVENHPGVHVEVGGTWIGGTQSEIIKLSEKLGLETFHTYYRYPRMDDNTLSSYPISHEAEQEFDRLDKLAQEVPLRDPWNHANAKEWDSITFLQWIEENVQDSVARRTLAHSTLLTLGDTAEHISFLFYLFFNHSLGGHKEDAGLKGGAQDLRYTKGSQIVAIALAEKVKSFGVKIEMETRVLHIDILDDCNIIHTQQMDPNGSTLDNVYKGKQTVMAMGTGDTTRISYTGLTRDREELMENWVLKEDGFLKSFAVYDKAFWRDMDIDVPISGWFFDYSPPGGVPGILMGFNFGEDTPEAKEERRKRIEVKMQKTFGEKGKAFQYQEHKWGLYSEYGTANCVQYTRPGMLTSKYFPSWRKSVHNLHWGGSDTSEIWMGYIDGAVRRGKQCANMVRTNLSH